MGYDEPTLGEGSLQSLREIDGYCEFLSDMLPINNAHTGVNMVFTALETPPGEQKT
jgi:hypothetical protein